MTCIVGFVENGNVWIGGDSQVTNGIIKNQLASDDLKVFLKKDILFGCSGLFRQCQLLNHSLTIPVRNQEETDFQYLCSRLVPAIIKCLKTHECIEINKNKTDTNLEVLVGYKNALYKIDSAFAVVHYNKPYTTIGSGREVALGALYATEPEPKLIPEHRVRKALEAAEQYCVGVRSPFTILCLKGKVNES
jgi:ATP-dependent protease HslVU (ClpYQ) peptidase subunit